MDERKWRWDMNWEEIEACCKQCTLCPLHIQRNHVVIGTGNKTADILFVGEGPGAQEDATGIPFVGKAGQLLDQYLLGVDLKREDVYIANIVKCRPPGNRDPKEEEKSACLPYLREQLKLIQPHIIICLGRIAATTIIDKNFKITRERGRWIRRKGYWFMATYHPAALLRDPTKKKDAWLDFKSLKEKYDQGISPCS